MGRTLEIPFSAFAKIGKGQTVIAKTKSGEKVKIKSLSKAFPKPVTFATGGTITTVDKVKFPLGEQQRLIQMFLDDQSKKDQVTNELVEYRESYNKTAREKPNDTLFGKPYKWYADQYQNAIFFILDYPVDPFEIYVNGEKTTSAKFVNSTKFKNSKWNPRDVYSLNTPGEEKLFDGITVKVPYNLLDSYKTLKPGQVWRDKNGTEFIIGPIHKDYYGPGKHSVDSYREYDGKFNEYKDEAEDSISFFDEEGFTLTDKTHPIPQHIAIRYDYNSDMWGNPFKKEVSGKSSVSSAVSKARAAITKPKKKRTGSKK